MILDPNKHLVRIITYYDYDKVYQVSNSELSLSLTTIWKRLTWGEQNSLYAQCMENGELNLVKFRDLKLKSCLKNWDMIDTENKTVAVTKEAIDELDAVIANDILSKFELLCEPTEDELTKLGEAVRNFYQGKNPDSGDLPQYLYEHILAKYYGWSLEEIRRTDHTDILAHVRMCLESDYVDKEFELNIHGGSTKSTKKAPTAKEFLEKKYGSGKYVY